MLKAEQLSRVDAWLRSILWDSKLPTLGSDKAIVDGIGNTNPEIHRLKARLPISNGDVKIVQGVREIFEILDAPKSEEPGSVASSSEGKVVLIGRNLQGALFEESFINTINS